MAGGRQDGLGLGHPYWFKNPLLPAQAQPQGPHDGPESRGEILVGSKASLSSGLLLGIHRAAQRRGWPWGPSGSSSIFLTLLLVWGGLLVLGAVWAFFSFYLIGPLESPIPRL